jgi:hypothetical protein
MQAASATTVHLRHWPSASHRVAYCPARFSTPTPSIPTRATAALLTVMCCRLNSLGVAEGDILSTVGWLHLVAAEDDGDYHIQISPTHDDDHGTDFLIVEVPTPEAEFVADTSLHPRLEAVRSLIRERMLQGREPSTRGSVLTHPACVEVAGQLFYDDAHVGDQPRGKRGMKAATLWELHPVTHIAFSRGCTQ